MTEAKDNKKAEIRALLIRTGRELVVQKGAEFLTARKLSEASGCSVGTIYNQCGNMDRFVIEQNILTLDELFAVLQKIVPSYDSYKNLNMYTDVYAGWVLGNENLWFLLFNFHLHHSGKHLPTAYLRRFVKLEEIWRKDFEHEVDNFGAKERKLFRQVLMLALFSLSSFLATQQRGRLSRKNICRLLLNSYLAGLKVLKRDR